MANKKKPIRVGIIRKEQLLKDSRPRQDIPFKTGKHLTEKKIGSQLTERYRPRKKFRSEDFTQEELTGDYDLEDDFDLEP